MPYKDVERDAAYRKGAYQRNVELVRGLKQRPCTDCGIQYPYYAMEFDHVPERGKKKFGLSMRDLGTRSEKSILKEIAKCDLVCANCHRIRTHTRWHNSD